MNLTTNPLYSFAPYTIDSSNFPFSFMGTSNQPSNLAAMGSFNFNYGLKFGMPVFSPYPVLCQHFPQQIPCSSGENNDLLRKKLPY